MSFSDSYLGRLRQKVGSQLLLVVGGRAILENEQGKILFHLRSDFNTWGLPGGSAEEGDSIESCVIREVLEETGLLITKFQAVGFSSDPQHNTCVYPNGDQVQGFGIILCVDEWTGQFIESNEETIALSFFNPDDSRIIESDKLAIEKCQQFKRTGEFQLF